jgi:uncharacterized repeat protein (TIGR03803 family)
MKPYALTLSVALVLLAGCAGSHAGSPLPGTLTDGSAAGPLGTPVQTLHAFRGSPRDGSAPNGKLISLNGILYGTTSSGGRGCHPHEGSWVGCGAIFSITPSGEYHLLYSFKGHRDGFNPIGGLVAMHGLLYGATSGGGRSCPSGGGSCGTIFSVSPSGKESLLYSFKGGSDGALPSGSLVEKNGTLYGVTAFGGVLRYCKGYESEGCGTVFALTTSGNERVVYRFHGGRRDGSYPSGELLALGGKLFGTTLFGGDLRRCGDGCGTIFDVTISGAERVLHRFGREPDGKQPNSLIGLNGLLYGTTYNGGSACGSYETDGCGTVFEATTSGTVRTIYTFKSLSEGAAPQSVVAVNGVLYGTAWSGGNVCGISGFYGGTLFGITTSGKKELVYRFPCSGGIVPSSGLLGLGDLLYGTASFGGEHHAGTIFTFRT